MSEEILNKAAAAGVIVSGGIGGITDPVLGTAGIVGSTTNDGGILNPQQSNQFIEYIFDQQVLSQDGRKVQMSANIVELEKLNVGERVVRAANQADGTYTNAEAEFTKVEITTKKVRLDWEVATEALEDNIERGGLEDHLVRSMTRAFANDLEDLAINGNSASVSDPFLKIMDGFHVKELTGNRATSVTGSGSWSVQDLQDIILAMPRKFRGSRAQMKFYTGSPTLSALLNQLAQTGNFSSERIVERIVDGSVPQVIGAPLTYRVLGLPIVEVPYFPDDYVSLTFPENRIWGFQRDVTVHREFKPKKDTTEYTVFVRFGVQIEEVTAVAYGSK